MKKSLIILATCLLSIIPVQGKTAIFDKPANTVQLDNICCDAGTITGNYGTLYSRLPIYNIAHFRKANAATTAIAVTVDLSAAAKVDVPTKLLTIDKSFISSELINYEVFRLNFFNILSNRCQTLQQKLWTSTSPTIKDKIVHFLLMRCQLSYGEKTLHISMDHLANMIDETRINVSRTLNEWQEKEWIQLRRKEIYIPKFERLIQDLM
jgi:CRP-like cAMP-binding protein